ncbi:formate/nitrite transporter family protein [Desulfuromonas acetoxidans]|uniref:formate/nitrite transporter family protein n=1 Tax=Desulfuromonas acetoxidans TaxID=891 RepID=UPI00292F6AD2|nr:formate/nitrite transporter family protein [Desulfuromonas acetoxidans]
MAHFIAPAELSQSLVPWGTAKARRSVLELLILGFLAGAYIGFAAHLATVVGTGDFDWLGMKKLAVGAVFSVGLMLVIIPGSELWTGNTLMGVSLLERQITWREMMRNWLLVYIGNLAGSLFLAWMIAGQTGILDGPIGVSAVKIAVAKVSQPVPDSSHNLAYFFRAVGCNWLVCLAILLAMAAQDIGGKILGIFFPIMAFVASGFEHAIANMYFIPAGIFARQWPNVQAMVETDPAVMASLNWSSMWIDNLLVVTLGNLVGGSIFVGGLYWLVYIRRADH